MLWKKNVSVYIGPQETWSVAFLSVPGTTHKWDEHNSNTKRLTKYKNGAFVKNTNVKLTKMIKIKNLVKRNTKNNS